MTVVYTRSIPLPNEVAEILKGITTNQYSRTIRGHTHAYELRGSEDYQLMQGGVVPLHSDGIRGYRPMLILGNPGSNYIIRGEHQRNAPQKSGTFLLLDIEALHMVKTLDPLSDQGPWLALVGKVGAKGEVDLDTFAVESAEGMAPFLRRIAHPARS